MQTRRDWLMALLVALAAGLLRALGSTRRGFWTDEYISIRAARMSLDKLVADRLQGGHSPLYYIYAKLGLLFGDSEWGWRLPSALLLVAAVLLLTGLMRQAGLRRWLPALWGICLVQPFWFSLGTQVRYMMMLVACAAGAAWAALAYQQLQSWRRGLLAAAALALMLWVHGSAQFFAAGLLAYLVWDNVKPYGQPLAPQRIWRAWPALAGFAGGLPLLYLIRSHDTRKAARFPDLLDTLKTLMEAVFADYHLWPDAFGVGASLLLVAEVALLGTAVWLTRRELLRRGQASLWRLLAATLAAVPLMIVLTCALVRNYANNPRYLTTFAIPAVVCLAIAWRARLAPRRRLAYRAALVAVLAVQASAAILDHGDRHREVIQWIRQVNHGEPVVIANAVSNHMALDYHRMQAVPTLDMGGAGGNNRNQQVIARHLKHNLAQVKRGFFIHYRSAVPLSLVMKDLKKKKFFLAERRWEINEMLVIGAFIRDESERAWLEALPEPKLAWGPARGGV